MKAVTDRDLVEAIVWLSNRMIAVGVVTLIVCMVLDFQLGITIASIETAILFGGRTVAKYLSQEP